MHKATWLLAILSLTTLQPANAAESTSQVRYAQGMEMLQVLQLQGNEKILAFGCRSRESSLWLAKQLPQGKVLALDHNQTVVALAQKELKNLNLKNIVVMQPTPTIFEFYKNTFDYIASFAYLHWVGNHEANFKLMHQVLKPGGKIMVCVGVSDEIGRKIPFQCHVETIAQRDRWKQYFTKLQSPWYHPLEAETAKRLLDSAGFTALRVAYVQHTASFASTSDLANWILTWSPHAALLPAELAPSFATEIAERYDAVCMHDAQGSILLECPVLEIEAEKSIIAAPTQNMPAHSEA